MSFSSEIKEMLCEAGGIKALSKAEMSAMLYGMFFAGKITAGKNVLKTESEITFAAAQTLCKKVFKNERYETKRLVLGNGSLFTLFVRQARELFGDLSFVNNDIVSGSNDTASAFLRGVFVCCGYVTDPKKGYHLEFVLPENERAKPLSDFIREHGMDVKTSLRQGKEIIYAKTSETIEDILTYIGAGNHSLEIMQVKIEKDIRNRANRSVNCDSANLDKTVAASEKSCRDIEFIFEKIGEKELSPALREAAVLRLENPESSLAELCAMMSEPISRAGLSHRLKKLSALAESLRGEENE